MKDATHHLKHVQRKVIQSSRKEAFMVPNYQEASSVNFNHISRSHSIKTSHHHSQNKKKALHIKMRKSLMHFEV